MRKIISLILLIIIGIGIFLTLKEIPFGISQKNIGDYFLQNGIKQTGAINTVTSVVVNYRGFDTLGEIVVLFTAAIGLGAILGVFKTQPTNQNIEPSSLIVYTGCRFLFPIIFIVGIYIFIHGHLTPGGGFQGGAVIASAFLLMYLGCPSKKINQTGSKVTETIAGLFFVGLGIAGLCLGKEFLNNFLPKGNPGSLFSAGIIPLVYIAIGLKVGSELAGIIDLLIETKK